MRGIVKEHRRILIACEFSGIVRDAFAARGDIVWSCDLLPCERDRPPTTGNHYQTDVFNVIGLGWDMMVAFPPCTHLASSGARWFRHKRNQQDEAIEFVRNLMAAPVEQICIENPIGVLSRHIRKPDQIIQPWQFGHAESKATCLWLKNLPKLRPTKILSSGDMPLFPDEETHKIDGRVHREPPSADRWKKRSRTYEGIANAMAMQWT